MDIKKIFNKKTGKSKSNSYSDGVNPDSNSAKSITSTGSSTNSSSKMTTNNHISTQYQVENNISSAQSFQYLYNSNTNSLFSSKRTMSTGFSSQPSSNVSAYSKVNEQAKITSIGRPLRVLHEEDQEDEGYSNSREEKSSIINEDNSASIHKNSISRKKSNFSDDVSICPTEKSNISLQKSSNSFNDNISENELKYQLDEYVKSQLRLLASSIGNILFQISQSVLNLTKASITISENINSTYKIIKNNKYLSLLASDQFDTINSIGLRRIIKSILHLFDNLLIGDVYNKSKASVIKNLYDLFYLIKIIPNKANELTNFITYMKPTIFPIDLNASNFPNVEKADQIMTSLLSKGKESLFSDQEGSFIAPVLRGFFLPSLTIITFIFGFPEISKEHHDVIKFFSTQSTDTHYLLQKNSIKYASTNLKNIKLKCPFRTIDENQGYVPISMSISSDSSLMSSGTLGGYLYPKVPENCSNSKLLKYRGQIFGITCAHVVLGNENGNEDNVLHPKVSTPSPVLINLFKNALLNEMNHHSNKSPEYKAYNEAVQMIDVEYPVKKMMINGKKYNRNLPSEDLGSIIWGERLINENRLSDLAIIKINDELKKKFVNYLGEDLQLSQYDPSLILSNLNVKRTVSLQPRKNGILNNANLNVFKVGSTSGFTKGKLNGMKMIYWSDGSLRSSEFIVAGSSGKMEGFANGGDSGAWVLSKLSEVNNIKGNFIDEFVNEDEIIEEDENKGSLSSFIESFIPSVGLNGGIKKSQDKVKKRTKMTSKDKKDNQGVESGLGLLGMLHSYDGDYKQFGLFTPIDDILERLETVTGIEWGVVGCTEECEGDGDGDLTEGASSRTTSISSTSERSYKESEEEYVK